MRWQFTRMRFADLLINSTMPTGHRFAPISSAVWHDSGLTDLIMDTPDKKEGRTNQRSDNNDQHDEDPLSDFARKQGDAFQQRDERASGGNEDAPPKD